MYHQSDVRLIDENGVAYGIKQSSNKPRVSSMPYTYDIAKGNITGREAVRRFGYNGDVGTSWETVCCESTLRNYLTSAERLQIASNDADDDGAPAGNGARTVRVTGLDASYDVITETVTMNGTTNVLTDASFLRVNGFTVLTAGSTGSNEGTITASNNADNAVLATIEPNVNNALCAAYTVPNGYTFYVVQAKATEATSAKGSHFAFFARAHGGLWTIQRRIVLLGSVVVLPLLLPMHAIAKTDIEIRVKAIQAGSLVTAGFEGWIEAV